MKKTAIYPVSRSIRKKSVAANPKVFHSKQPGHSRKFRGAPSLIPGMNVAETSTEYLFTVAAPGLRRENFLINISGNTMVLSAKKEMHFPKAISANTEYDYSHWTKMLILPSDADSLLAQAEYQNGELNIHVPKGDTSMHKIPATIYVY